MFTCLGLLKDNLQEATPQHATPSAGRKKPRMQGGQGISRCLIMEGGEKVREASSKQRKLEAFV